MHHQTLSVATSEIYRNRGSLPAPLQTVEGPFHKGRAWFTTSGPTPEKNPTSVATAREIFQRSETRRTTKEGTMESGNIDKYIIKLMKWHRPFSCSLCARSFYRAHQLKHHLAKCSDLKVSLSLSPAEDPQLRAGNINNIAKGNKGMPVYPLPTSA